jgi:uncharacterized protein (DUF302 family)
VLYMKDTSGTVDSVSQRLADEARSHRMTVIAIHDVKDKLALAGITFPHDCRVLELWNPQRIRRALELDMAVSTVLPSRIAVFEREGKVRIALIKPTALLDLYQHPELEPIAQEAEDAMICLVEAVCR